MNAPLISVIMPVYNRQKYLKQAIDSILAQTYKNFEFIIINDGSTDNTEAIILAYSDKRIQYVKNPKNLKIVAALNKGIKLAKGQYIARMDSDDISLPQRLQTQINFMQNNPDCDICGTWIEQFGKSNKIVKYPTKHEQIKVNLLFDDAISHPSIMGKMTLFENFCYDENYNSIEDTALWIKTIDNYQFANIPIILLKMRLHLESTVHRYGKKRLKIIAATKQLMLAKMGCCLSENELKKFVNARCFKRYMSSKVAHKILNANKKSKFLEQKYLEKTLIKHKMMTEKGGNNYIFRTFLRFIDPSLRRYLIPKRWYLVGMIRHTLFQLISGEISIMTALKRAHNRINTKIKKIRAGVKSNV